MLHSITSRSDIDKHEECIDTRGGACFHGNLRWLPKKKFGGKNVSVPKTNTILKFCTAK